MHEFYLTFGSDHTRDKHPHLAVDAHPDGWVTIEAERYEDARAAALHLCDTHWCWLYIDPSDEPPPRKDGVVGFLDSYMHPYMRTRFFPAGELARYRAEATRFPHDVVLFVDLVNVPIGTLTQR